MDDVHPMAVYILMLVAFAIGISAQSCRVDGTCARVCLPRDGQFVIAKGCVCSEVKWSMP